MTSSRQWRLKPSQIIFERHFGVHGNCYVVKARLAKQEFPAIFVGAAQLNHVVRFSDLSALKVALIQIVTVLVQAFGKVGSHNLRGDTPCSQ